MNPTTRVMLFARGAVEPSVRAVMGFQRQSLHNIFPGANLSHPYHTLTQS